jgi:hypothetical protein
MADGDVTCGGLGDLLHILGHISGRQVDGRVIMISHIITLALFSTLEPWPFQHLSPSSCTRE